MEMGAYNYTAANMSGEMAGLGFDVGYFSAISMLRTLGHPLVAGVGLVGNTLSTLVFLTRTMRASSCSVFLASLALVDNVFLICLLSNWVDGHFYKVLVNEMACTCFVFASYVSGFLSVWFIVGFTCERFFALCFPLRSALLCSTYREKLTVFLLIALATTMYSFTFWTTGVVHTDDGIAHCSPKYEYLGFLNIVTWGDTIITVVIPFFIILIMNTKVIYTMVHDFPAKADCEAFRLKPLDSSNKSDKYENKSFKSRRRPTRRVTRTMLLVSMTFLVLNLPSHIFRLYNLFSSVLAENNYAQVSWKLTFLQEVAQLLYYATFSCNFVLYTLFGRNFKRALMAMLRCQSSRETHRVRMRARFSSAHTYSITTSL